MIKNAETTEFESYAIDDKTTITLFLTSSLYPSIYMCVCMCVWLCMCVKLCDYVHAYTYNRSDDWHITWNSIFTSFLNEGKNASNITILETQHCNICNNHIWSVVTFRMYLIARRTICKDELFVTNSQEQLYSRAA